jgi:hypothetical protein
MENVECPLTVTSHRRIPVKNIFGSSVIVFCESECEIIELFPEEFYAVSVAHKFEFRFVTNEIPNKWR